MGFSEVFVTVLVVSGLCLLHLLWSPLHWNTVTAENIIHSNDLLLTSSTLLIFRRVCLYIVVSSLAYVVLDPAGLTVTVVKHPEGSSTSLRITHLARLTTFTVWSWLLIGIYFSLVLYATHSELNSSPVNDALVQLIWVLYEICFAVSLLITVLVSFVLIPMGNKKGIPIDYFFKTPALLMHNANVVFMALEGAGNRLPIVFSHFPFVALYGITYVVFSWIWFHHKGVFYYFFLDYERPHAVLSHLGLIFVLAIFFEVGVMFSYLTEQHSPLILLGMLLSLSLIIKVRDPSSKNDSHSA